MGKLGKGKGRSCAIDLVKAWAIFGVLVIHTTSSWGYQGAVGSFSWGCSLFWGSLCRASVPLFFMCSGALMLDPARELTGKRLFARYLPRLAAAMAVWAMVYKLVYLAEGGGLSLGGVVRAAKETALFQQEYHFYYLHIILLFYLCLPVVRVFTAHAGRRQLEYALGVWFLLGIVYPTVIGQWPFTLMGGIARQWKMNMTYAAMGYGLLGHYLQSSRPKPWLCGVLAAAGFGVVFGGTWLKSAGQGSLSDQYLQGMSWGVCLLAAGVFGLFQAAGRKAPGWLRAGAAWLSNASFCIYLCHVLFIHWFIQRGVDLSFCGTWASVPLLALLVGAASCGVYLVLSRIPLVKEWLL